MVYIYKKPFTMKTTYLLAVLFFLLLSSCDWFDSVNKDDDSSSLSGSTNIPINTVGNTFSSSIKIGGVPYSGNSSIKITSIDDGVATVHVNSNLPSTLPVASLIGSSAKDASGNLNYDLKVKMTDEGILDYTNKDHEPFVLVKYDAKVGDTYTLEKSDGATITRKVVSKSTTDDHAWGGILIKTINVEQDSRMSGIKKIEYIANHKFGLVAIRIYFEDGTTSQIDLFSAK